MFKHHFEDSPHRPRVERQIFEDKKELAFFGPIYFTLFEKIPSFVTVASPSGDMENRTAKKERVIRELVKLEFKALAELDGSPIDRGAEDAFLVEKDGLMLYFAEGASHTLSVFYDRKNEAHLRLIGMLDKVFSPKKETKGNVFFISRNYSELSLNSVKVKPHRFDPMNYNEGFDEHFKDLVLFANSGESGMFLLGGPPGVGKSCMIKSLIGLTHNKVIFLSSTMINLLSDPGFQSFAFDELKNSCFIIEDAENLLSNRHSERSEATTNLLSLTDGLLGDALKIRVVATYNCNQDDIDPALKRKGRLKKKIDFELLTKERSQKLIDELGVDYKVEEAMSLADLYNIKTDNGVAKKQQRRMGFQ